MQILHLSHTPLVGAPGRICRALNMLPEVSARWAVLDSTAGNYSKIAFDLDLCWDNNKDEIIYRAEQADVIHLHNYIGLETRDFSPLDFNAMWRRSKPMVRQFHSNLELLSRYSGETVQSILGCPIPKLVIAQYQERYFPTAKLVPNIVFPVERAIVNYQNNDYLMRIGYAPSRFNSARVSRWDTKGYPETIRLLKSLSRSAKNQNRSIDIDIIESVSHHECIARKANCNIIIDDLVTGSYHLNTLESLIQGSAVLSYLDRRTLQAVAELSGRNDFPVIDVGLEHAEEVLLDLIAKPEITIEIGNASRQWMLKYWNPLKMSRHFIDAYQSVLEAPHNQFPARFGNDFATRWLLVDRYDAEWRTRSTHWPAVTPGWLLKLKGLAGKTIRKFYS